MKEILEQSLIKLIEQIEKVGVFALDQLPLIVSEVLMYYTLHHIVLLILSIVFLSPTFITIILYKSKDNWLFDYDGDLESDGSLAFFIIQFFTAMVGLIIFFTNILQLIKVLVAPRLYLIEKLSSLI